MRIISGKAKGVRLSALSSKRTRPILDRAKESLFNILGDSLLDSIVLDLFAGTGSLGVEALSRGAKRCLFVDNSTNAILVIKKNLQDAGFPERSVVLKINVFRLLGILKNKHLEFDLMLVAPPYKLLDLDCRERKRIFSMLDECVSRKIINETGVIVLQHHKKQTISKESFKQLKIIDERRYGTTQFTFLGIDSSSNNVNKNNCAINRISLKAPAKINLFLEILGKRDDGYHEIETVMQEIDLVDNLQFEEIQEGVRLKCNDKNIPSDENNLVCKAANLILNECGIKKGVLISLEKNIPVGAGLGGGSSDAAATLKALNLLWKIGLNDAKLMEFAAKLGSDIPFFIKGKTSLCSGRGEKITPIEVKTEMNYLIIFPHINISTTTIYRNLKIDLTKKIIDVSFFLDALKHHKVADISKLLFNRLEEVIFATYPDLLDVKRALDHFDFCGLSVSGSGSAFFGLCKDRQQAEAIKGKIELSDIGNVFAVTNVITP